MKFNKAIIVPLAIASFALSGCFINTNPGGDKSSSALSSRNDPNEVKTISARIKAGYGSITEGTVSLLFDGILLPFSYEEYDIDYLILICFVLKLLQYNKSDILAFIRQFEDICENFRKQVPINIYSQIVHTDSRRKISVLKTFL